MIAYKIDARGWTRGIGLWEVCVFRAAVVIGTGVFWGKGEPQG